MRHNISIAHDEVAMRLELRSGRLLSHHVRDVLVRVDIAESDDFALNTFLKKANLDCDVLQGFMCVNHFQWQLPMLLCCLPTQ